MGRRYAPSSAGLFVLHNTIKKQFERRQLADVQTAFLGFTTVSRETVVKSFIPYWKTIEIIDFTPASC